MTGGSAGGEPSAPPRTAADAFFGGRLTLRQRRHGHRAGDDAILLAAAAPPLPEGARLLDAGAGVGAAALCYLTRVAGPRAVLLERCPETAATAAENIHLNGFSHRAVTHCGDIRAVSPEVPRNGFDLVLTNPPWLEDGRAAPSPDASRRAAHMESEVGLRPWLDHCIRFLKPRGRLLLIHRVARLQAVMAALQGRMGGICLIPLYPRVGAAATRMVLCARKGVASPTRLTAGLVLHNADGGYSDDAERILRGGAALPSE